ncbi:Cytochrome c7 c [uncultured archaeon]|nr:Cytochrome c7 c [uncultured archaeon]
MYVLKNRLIIFGILLFAASMTPVAMAGFENCIYCHGTIAWGMPYVNLTYMNSSMHGRINNSNDLNYACYACHWDGTPPKNHANNISRIKTCEDCHTGNLFNAPQVTEHIPNGQNINTSIDCISCHSNSVDTNAGYTGINDRVAHFGTTADLMSPSNRSTDCTWCHFDNSGNAAWGSPPDPRVSGALNHTRFNNSTQCYSCHVTGGGTPPTFHDSSLGRGGGRDCVSCHDTGGIAPKLVDVSATGDNRSVHSSLNSDSVTTLDRNNLRCWACHGDGDGSESAQPTGGHPLNYKTPKSCNNNDCHSISQSRYKEPMIYSHFQNASLNGNPNDATNYNITVSSQCQTCHINSVVKIDNNPDIALVSHYGSKDNLVDSFNCAYCHLDKDNSEDWGTATLVNKNRTGLVALERERNRFTVNQGDSAYLGGGYFLKLVEVSANADEAIVRLLKNDTTVDEVSLGIMTPYEYDEKIIIDNSTLKIPAITLNITSIFGGNNSFIQFEGYRSRKVHTDKESEDSACYACHLYRYSGEKERYLVIDKDSKESYDEIYYTRVLIDFKPENKSKLYFDDDDYVFDQLRNNSGKYLSVPDKQKYLKEGETWNIADNYSLKVNEVSTDSKDAWLTLMIDGSIAESRVVPLGAELEYTPGIRYKAYTETNVTVFTAKINYISQGPNFIILGDVVALSPDIMKTTSNVTLFGYNTSWFKPNDTFAVGKIPPDLHAPNLYDDRKNWADCVSCHDASKNLGIPALDAISSRLGKHSKLNDNASDKAFLSDPIDKACWACHTGGAEPQMHSPTYVTPRDCKSCHTYQEKPFFGAIYVGDEPHGNQSNCESCHIEGTHTLKRFQVTPVVKDAVISKKEVNTGETVNITAEAIAGYGMRIRAVEYFLDKTGIPGNGTSLKPLDGAFNSQIEQVTAELNTTNISTGAHIIYIRAMERNNRWGDFSQVNFSITSGGAGASKALENARAILQGIPALDLIYLLLSLAAAYFIVLGFIRR